MGPNEGARGGTLNSEVFKREYWTGSSRDGLIFEGDGYHYYRMSSDGKILEAYEYYETDDGDEVVTPLPEMENVSWQKDLGFDDFGDLDEISKYDFERVKEMQNKAS